jgi:hypothetical protein
MIALRVAELRVLAAASKATASIETETRTARFVMRNIHPDAAKALREFASQVRRRPGWRCGVGLIRQAGTA